MQARHWMEKCEEWYRRSTVVVWTDPSAIRVEATPKLMSGHFSLPVVGSTSSVVFSCTLHGITSYISCGKVLISFCAPALFSLHFVIIGHWNFDLYSILGTYSFDYHNGWLIVHYSLCNYVILNIFNVFCTMILVKCLNRCIIKINKIFILQCVYKNKKIHRILGHWMHSYITWHIQRYFPSIYRPPIIIPLHGFVLVS